MLSICIYSAVCIGLFSFCHIIDVGNVSMLQREFKFKQTLKCTTICILFSKNAPSEKVSQSGDFFSHNKVGFHCCIHFALTIMNIFCWTQAALAYSTQCLVSKCYCFITRNNTDVSLLSTNLLSHFSLYCPSFHVNFSFPGNFARLLLLTLVHG